MGALGGILRTIHRDERFAVGSGMFRHRVSNELDKRRGMEIVLKVSITKIVLYFIVSTGALILISINGCLAVLPPSTTCSTSQI
jgi:hypothetical protein